MILAFIWTLPLQIAALLVLIQLSLLKICQHLCTSFNKPEIQSTSWSSSEGYIVSMQSHAKFDNFALIWRSSGGKSIQKKKKERKINLPIYDVGIIHRCSTKLKDHSFVFLRDQKIWIGSQLAVVNRWQDHNICTQN